MRGWWRADLSDLWQVRQCPVGTSLPVFSRTFCMNFGSFPCFYLSTLLCLFSLPPSDANFSFFIARTNMICFPIYQRLHIHASMAQATTKRGLRRAGNNQISHAEVYWTTSLYRRVELELAQTWYLHPQQQVRPQNLHRPPLCTQIATQAFIGLASLRRFCHYCSRVIVCPVLL